MKIIYDIHQPSLNFLKILLVICLFEFLFKSICRSMSMFSNISAIDLILNYKSLGGNKKDGSTSPINSRTLKRLKDKATQ